jgi:glutathionylspermidine synthase
MFASEHGYAVLGSWIVRDEPCGLGMREDSSPITMNLSRFVPHIILDEGQGFPSASPKGAAGTA